ncbi:MAG: 4a-hydroxytetrahydrobiopterin dehydratase [Acidobacteriota bacterium]
MVAPALLKRVERELPGWRVEGDQLVGRWNHSDFAGPLAAAVRIGLLAERADHHPDLLVSWGRLEVRLTTHSDKTLTVKDVELASAIQKSLGSPTG